MKVDLHTHSLCSDGTQTPADLIAEAASSGVTALGLTDHDTVRGWDEAARAAGDHGIGLVRGMEVSCRFEGVTVHMLSYLHDPEGTELTAVVEQARAARLVRGETMALRIAEDYPISWEEIRAAAGEHATIGRPHIADALVRAGVVPDRTAAFESILASGGRYHVPLQTISPVDAVRLIHEAGGVAVFAHPLAAARGRVVGDAGMREIIGAGLDGLEVDHRDNPPEARERLRALASEHGLIVTGSSDYHGTGKPNRLAEHTTAPDQLDRICERATGTAPIGIG